VSFARHYTLTGHIFDTNFFYANLAWYRRLAPERQLLLDGLIADPAAARTEIRGMSDTLLATLRANPAAGVIDVPADTLARWRSATAPALAKIVAQSGPRASEVAEAIAKGRMAFSANRRAGP
jgi:TRAP-type C4-dicarboxylate transport system substrate-binding protein